MRMDLRRCKMNTYVLGTATVFTEADMMQLITELTLAHKAENSVLTEAGWVTPPLPEVLSNLAKAFSRVYNITFEETT